MEVSCSTVSCKRRCSHKPMPAHTSLRSCKQSAIFTKNTICTGAMVVNVRDIKPENLLFVDKSEKAGLKLIDFGAACYFENSEICERKRVGTVLDKPNIVLLHCS